MNSAKLLGLGFILALGTNVLVLHGCKIHPHGHDNLHKQHCGDDDANFVARHIRKQATITLNGTIESVWPLFDPINESKWATIWQPNILYPTDGTVQEGMVFRTGELIWTVARYNSRNHHITYSVTHPDKFFTVDVQCSEHGSSHTDAVITYSFVGLTEQGNDRVERSAERLFQSGLKDWQTAINHYLKTGKALPHEQHGRHEAEHSESH